MITRAASDSFELAEAIQRHGWLPVLLPLIERTPQPDAIVDAVHRSGPFDWVLVTSPATSSLLLSTGLQASNIGHKIAAVGPKSGQVLSQAGWRIDHIAPEGTMRSLVSSIPNLTDANVLYPKSEHAPEEPIRWLIERGAKVTSPVAYLNREPKQSAELFNEIWPCEAALLCSGTAARRFANLLKTNHLRQCKHVIAIGPSTTLVARSNGLVVHATATPHTIDGLVNALSTRIRE